MKFRPSPIGQKPLRTVPRARAFTLVELLAAMTVLVLLLSMVAQMVNGALAVTTGSTKRLDADSQARLIFDRMAVDLSQIVKRTDVDYFFQKKDSGQSTTGLDDQMAFYSETTGYYPPEVTSSGTVPSYVPKSNAALVGYCIRKNSGDNRRQLARLSKALVWNGYNTGTLRAMTFLPQTLVPSWPLAFGPDSSTTLSTADMSKGVDTDYQVIGEQVFRMETCYLIRNATTATTLSATPYVPPATSTSTSTTTVLPYNGLRDVVAVVVSLALLDNASRTMVVQSNDATQLSDLDKAASQLEDVTANTFVASPTKTPAQYWQTHINNNELSKASGVGSLPPAVASQVRIYERYFYLGNAQ